MLVGKSWQQTERQVCMCVWVRVCVCVCVYIYIYIYIYAVVTGCTYYGYITDIYIGRWPRMGGHPLLWLGDVLRNPHRINLRCYEIFQKASDNSNL